MDTIKTYIESNPTLKEEIAAQAAAGKTSFSYDDVKAAAEKLGLDVSALETASEVPEGELSDELLEAVTGGGRISISIGGYTIYVNTPW